MATIGNKPAKVQSADKVKPTWSAEVVRNSMPQALLNAGGNIPVSFEKGEVRPVSPVVQGSGAKFGFFQYIEYLFEGAWYGSRVMMITDDPITGKEKSLELTFKGVTALPMQVLTGFNR